ncbi:hypothetical protein PTSG_01616 [Salpingoeca rosetta]|uniref:Major facilitator superfamily (MFS) profile domain-containing protein n=1 Tax=Salpingoeca rosetta (strain ATCC 50818 / BSB-021) TaxID=946362 RepID=F2TYG4_SALR5|nr:uncharacterized protein PTSG_01616 [Salpingoeca rosetta]EGD78638.1 hypothetical protein PTSG_01616 [Salpingoeca rosetta]|eukprot:XP_004997596.1 hypothetical protein PTSG_01616 [Salpingoeca rosetta]
MKMKMKRSNELHLIRAIYFVQCLVGCCVSNFLVLYLSYRHLDSHEVGIIIGTVYPFSQMIGQPVWSSIADCTGRHKACMLWSLVTGSAVIFCALYMATFAKIALVIGAGALLTAGVNPLLDNTTLVSLEYHGVPLSNYGRFRVYGAVGWGVSALGLGPLIDRFGVPVIFYAFAVSSVLYVALIAILPFSGGAAALSYGSIQCADDGADSGNQQPPAPTAYWMDGAGDEQAKLLPPSTTTASNPPCGAADVASRGYLRTLLGQRYTLLFFFMVVSMGIGKGVIDAFLFLYLQELDAPATLMGLTLAVTTVSEIPFFFFSGELIAKCGAIYTVSLALCAYAARLLYYSQLTRAWLVLPIELLHGLTFGLSWAAVASYSYKISPKGYEATTQGITSALFWGLGFGLGACGGGFINQAYGFVFLFWMGCTFAASACIVALLWYYIETRLTSSSTTSRTSGSRTSGRNSGRNNDNNSSGFV